MYQVETGNTTQAYKGLLCVILTFGAIQQMCTNTLETSCTNNKTLKKSS